MRRFAPHLIALACLLPSASALAVSSSPSELGTAIDTTIGKIKLAQIRGFRTVWGPQDSYVAAAIATAPADANLPSLLSAIEEARNAQAAPINPFITSPATTNSNTDMDLLSAIQTAKADGARQVLSCILPFALGNTGGYQGYTLCVAPSNRDEVRHTLFAQSGWQLAASFNNTDLATSPDGFGVLFLYTPAGVLRQVLVLINAAQ